MRAYPKGTRVGSSNLDPVPFWKQGVQMVALNWQEMNASMMLNWAMFAGTGGWILKPSDYCRDAAPPAKQDPLDITIRLLAAQNLDSHLKTAPNAYVKCELHTDGIIEVREGAQAKDGKGKDGKWKSQGSARHSHDPEWAGETLRFENLRGVTRELSFIRYVLSVLTPKSLSSTAERLVFVFSSY